MIKPITGMALLAGLALGCGDPQSGSSGGAVDPETAEAEALLDELDVPTEEEADERAAAAIDESNADEELERLMAEIEADDEGL